jgi:hypothetical protein
MKNVLIATALLFLTVDVYAQGTIDFKNDSATPVRNGLTDANVLFSQGIQAALFWAPLSNPDVFTQLGNPVSVGFPVPGIFIGGTRTTGAETAAGASARFIVKAWEAAYGATYEAAVAAAPMGGRIGLRAQSPVFLLTTGGGGTPPTNPTALVGTTMNPGFTGFTVVVPEPSIFALGLWAASSLLLFRRRK